MFWFLETDPPSLPSNENQLQQSSDENITSVTIIAKEICLDDKRKQKRHGEIHLSDDDDDTYNSNSNFDANYAPSSESSSYSDNYQTQGIEKGNGIGEGKEFILWKEKWDNNINNNKASCFWWYSCEWETAN